MDELIKELKNELENGRDNFVGEYCTIKSSLLDQAIGELQRLHAIIEGQQDHGETYGRRSGGAKEALFK